MCRLNTKKMYCLSTCEKCAGFGCVKKESKNIRGAVTLSQPVHHPNCTGALTDLGDYKKTPTTSNYWFNLLVNEVEKKEKEEKEQGIVINKADGKEMFECKRCYQYKPEKELHASNSSFRLNNYICLKCFFNPS